MSYHRTIWSCLALGLLPLTQCRSPQEQSTSEDTSKNAPMQQYTYQQGLMGTMFYITLYIKDHPKAKTMAELAARAAFEIAGEINHACSDYDVTSELMKLNAAPSNQAIPISDTLFEVLDAAQKIAKQTQGAYDPTLGHHSYNWRMARKKSTLPSSQHVSIAIVASGWKHLQLDPIKQTVTKIKDNMRLDLGGIAKGYAADKMLHTLKKYLITRASITAGGEVRLGDAPPNRDGWEVTLKTLDAQHQLTPQTILLSNCAISTSGDLHQSITIEGKRYSHIVDPATGLGLTTRVSATVIGPLAIQTDALATAHCVNPSLQSPQVQTLVIRENQQGELKSYPSNNWTTSSP